MLLADGALTLTVGSPLKMRRGGSFPSSARSASKAVMRCFSLPPVLIQISLPPTFSKIAVIGANQSRDKGRKRARSIRMCTVPYVLVDTPLLERWVGYWFALLNTGITYR